MTDSVIWHDSLSLINDKLTFINKNHHPDNKLATSLPQRTVAIHKVATRGHGNQSKKRSALDELFNF